MEQRSIRLKHDTFSWISPEDLQNFKLRWDKLVKELTRVGIDIAMLPLKNRFLQFVSALKLYGHSTAVQMACIMRASEVDTNNDYDIPKFYDTLVSVSISQHPITTGVPQIKDATALQARTIGQQLKGSKKSAGKKGKIGKESSSSSQPPKESSESNPHTKALVEKKAKETGNQPPIFARKSSATTAAKPDISQPTVRRRRPANLRSPSPRTRARRSGRYSRLSKSVMLLTVRTTKAL